MDLLKLYSYYEPAAEEAIGAMIVVLVVAAIISIGVAIGCIFGCRAIARSKGLQSSYMWLGLLGVIGIIIVAVMNPKEQAPPYNPYAQNPYQQPNQYPPQYPPYGAAPYGQPGQPVPPNGYAPNANPPIAAAPNAAPAAGGPQQDISFRFCANCGQANDKKDTKCSRCGAELK